MSNFLERTVAAGGGLAHPSVMACSWYMKLCRRVLFGWRPAAEASAAPPSPPNPPSPARLPPPPSESWNVAYGEMSSAVSVTHHRHCLPFKSRRDEFFMWQSTFFFSPYYLIETTLLYITYSLLTYNSVNYEILKETCTLRRISL